MQELARQDGGLPKPGSGATTRLNGAQCVTLLGEIALVAEVLSDALLRRYLTQVHRLVSTCVGLSDAELIIEGP